ncbi:MAG TPA: phosphoglucomutase/phosphomannomutase family protein [Thermodesulfobacteriota bacterium]|nr:phosphoglucomutase/phosphomannomutase family protein [Thermodesulfobacteriota bacterium]
MGAAGRIAFGTSGWRGILAKEVTVDRVARVVRAIADEVGAAGRERGLLLAHDGRFLSELLIEEAAAVLAGAGVRALATERPTPTPAVSFEILRRPTAGAINFTASHNPPEYHGVKFSPEWGGPALPETTRRIEARANALLESGAPVPALPLDEARRAGLVETADPREGYLARLRELVDLEAVARAGVAVVYDPMYGAARGYLDEALRRAGVAVEVLHDRRDPYFGGRPPDPAEAHLPELIARVCEGGGRRLGLATDGDADRFGVVDLDGRFVQPNYLLALFADYLCGERRVEGGIARSVATTHLLDAVAAKHGRPLYETPVGFKYLGELIRDGRVCLGGEESAGFSMRGHVPEKDGILACLLAAELVARRGRPLGEQLAALMAEVGPVATRRENLRLTARQQEAFARRLEELPDRFGGLAVERVEAVDGKKVRLAGGAWLLMRASGTEPVVRLYGEARDEPTLERIMAAGRAFILGAGGAPAAA